MSLADAARELDVSPATLRRRVGDGLVPLPDGEWTRGSLAHARIVARLYRDEDYYDGREVNLAARVGARAAGGEVLVTRPLTEAAGRHLEFERIGEVKLKGFSESTELFLAQRAEEEDS